MRRKGICFVCGCSDVEACRPNGFDWANVKQTLCSECAPLTRLERAHRRRLALDVLQNRLADLQKRIAVLESED